MKIFHLSDACEASWQAAFTTLMHAHGEFNLYTGYVDGQQLCQMGSVRVKGGIETSDPSAIQALDVRPLETGASASETGRSHSDLASREGAHSTEESDSQAEPTLRSVSLVETRDAEGSEKGAGRLRGGQRGAGEQVTTNEERAEGGEEVMKERKRKFWRKRRRRLLGASVPGTIVNGVPLHEMERYSLCGARVRGGILAADTEQLRNMLEAIQVKKAVIAVMASVGFEDMLENWLCYVTELGIQNYFIITDSFEQAQRMAARGHSAFFLRLAAAANRSLDYGTLGYKQFILERTRMVGNILELHYHVLLADVDAVWLSNPFDHMRSTKIDIYAQLEPSGFLCGGFLYLRSTPPVVKLWKRVTEMFEATVERMAQEIVAVQPEGMKAFLRHYEHLHEQRYLNYMVAGNRSSAIVRGLDMNLFPNGRDYFAKQKPQKAGIQPVAIHNNYIVGKQNKTRRFVETGLWRVGNEKGMCGCLTCHVDTKTPYS
eukprot:TRINITY_DN15868_c0_g1_i1.p1 TRINITY_DN15868_c0_g1~~TRINITY_DN15868_c0_g1_i1.p1  ORF type:complete len:488 (+),score=96.79 TRINITY_DN15868_c0_g1_i1:2258-3721(+)